MAIWPFGRKNKRHTIQVSPTEAAVLESAVDHDPPAPEPKLSRRASKRRSSRLSRSGDGSDSIRGSTRPSSHRPISSIEPRTLETQFEHVVPEAAQHPLSRTGSLLKKQAQNGPNKLRRRLSKRKANEIMREREIRMLSSTPIEIPRRVGAMTTGGDYLLEHRRRRANGRRADRYHSDMSLSVRDSAASSLSDVSDPYTFKVNAFAALTPRPVVRYVEAPRLATAKSQNPPGSGRHQAATMSQENLYYSRRRVNELADSLDAGALRELLDRDRRRREKQQMDDQEKLRQKLQEQADAQEAKENQDRRAEAPVETHQNEPEEGPKEEAIEKLEEQNKEEPKMEQVEAEANPDTVVAEQPASQWPPTEKEHAERQSLESTRHVGPMDGSVIPKLAPRSSFAPSHEPALSRTTLSPSHSSLRQGISSASHSQNFGVGSTSDLSDRRPSETSGRRGGSAITSLFRRGSSRLKRTYRERFQDSSPEVSNASHESFYKIQTQASPPPTSTIIPPRTLIPTGTVKRSQSKFTEHFSDEPMPAPDSRLQSPDIPEEVPESSHEDKENPAIDPTIDAPTPSTGVDIVNPRRRRHQSWTESCDAESDNLPLSQSLASIDSEGSWMSGQFFRRMNHKPSSPVRTNMTSFGSAMDGTAETLDESRDSVDSRGAHSNVIGDDELEAEGGDARKPAETWHSEVGRRPIVVTPTTRPKSNQGMLKSIPSLSPISAEEDWSPVEEDAPVFSAQRVNPQRVASMHGEISHVDHE